MQCMLDTDTCIYLIKRNPDIKPKSTLSDCFISTIVQGELEFGVANSRANRREQNVEALLDFLTAIQVLPVTESVAQTYGEIRAAIKKQPIGPNDTWIAAHAVSLGLTLITNNHREFSRVPELHTDNWLSPGSQKQR